MSHQELITKALDNSVIAMIQSIDQLPQDAQRLHEGSEQEYEVYYLDPVDVGRKTSKWETRWEPSLEILAETEITLGRNSDVVDRLKQAINGFVDAEGKFLKFWGSFGSAEDLRLSLVTEYFRRVGGFKYDSDVVKEICKQFVDDVASEDVWIESVYLLQSFSAPYEIELDDGVNMRPIALQDIDRYCRTSPTTNMLGIRSIASDDWILEIRRKRPKSDPGFNSDRDRIMDMVSVTFNLAKPGRAIFQLLESGAESPFLRNVTTSSDNLFPTSGLGSQLVLTETDVKQVQSIYSKLKRVFEDNKYKDLQLPYRRLRSASLRGSAREDILLDHIIGLERLLCKDSDQIETSWRFRLRGAALLPDSFGNANDRLKLMRELYNIRSNIVHGNSDQHKVQDLLPQAEQALRHIMLWYLNAIENVGNPSQIIAEMNRVMIDGGNSWANDVVSQGDK